MTTHRSALPTPINPPPRHTDVSLPRTRDRPRPTHIYFSCARGVPPHIHTQGVGLCAILFCVFVFVIGFVVDDGAASCGPLSCFTLSVCAACRAVLCPVTPFLLSHFSSLLFFLYT